MNENLNRKNWKPVAVWTLLAATFLISLGFTESRRSQLKCSQVVVTILDSLGHAFVEPADISQIVQDKFGQLVGQSLSSINISLLEKIISNNPFVARVEVFSTIDGKLLIEVVQRRPVVRIVNFKNESFYIDDRGIFMPLSDQYTARVPVANGYLFDQEAERQVRVLTEKQLADTSVHVSLLEKIYRVAEYLGQHDFWNAQIEQIYVNAQGELELIPRVGNHVIEFGNDSDIHTKFDKLMLFYKEGLPATGWNNYRTINLKFKNQVVCTKNK